MKEEARLAQEFAEYKRAAIEELETLRARVQELEIAAGVKTYVAPDPGAQPVQPPTPPTPPAPVDEDEDEPEPDADAPVPAPADVPPIAGVDVPIEVKGADGTGEEQS